MVSHCHHVVTLSDLRKSHLCNWYCIGLSTKYFQLYNNFFKVKKSDEILFCAAFAIWNNKLRHFVGLSSMSFILCMVKQPKFQFTCFLTQCCNYQGLLMKQRLYATAKHRTHFFELRCFDQLKNSRDTCFCELKL